MGEGAGSVGPKNWKGLLLRRLTERWARDIITEIRSGKRKAPEGSAINAVAQFKDEQNKLLPTDVAAGEIINFLRPIVSVSRFITFIGLALPEHPEYQ